jgi:DNA-binding winged helix-turn-helix (wHTH) protein
LSVAFAGGIVADVDKRQRNSMPAIPSVYEFGAFRLDSAERLLLKAGQPVSLTPKAFDLLVYLVERPGRLVTKQELLSAIWQDTFVEETNLTYTVSALRKGLGDGQDTEPLIQTVPTRGYRFVAPVTREANASVSPSERPAGSIQPLARRLGIAALAVAVIAILAILFHRSPEATEPHSRFTIPLPDSVVGGGSFLQARIALSQISPDGQRVAFIVQSVFRGARVPRIWIRRLDALQADEVSGSEGAASLFWAPDSQQLAFSTRSALKKLRVSDGTVQTLCDPCQHDGYGTGTWSRGGLIVVPSLQGSLLGIREGGGVPQALTSIDQSKGEIAHDAPQFLPDGQRFLYVIRNKDSELSGLYVGQVGSTERKLLFKGEQPAIYAAPGYLLFPLAGNLVARPFDPTRLEFSGDPMPLFPLSEFLQDWRGRIPVSASDTGRLTHVIFQFPSLQFQWVGRAGELQRLVGEPGAYQSFGLSPDSRWLAVTRLGVGNASLWEIDVEHGGLSRLTYGDTSYTDPRWVGNSRRLVTTRWRPEPQGVVQISRASPELVISTSPPLNSTVEDVSRDERYVLYKIGGQELLTKPVGEGSGTAVVVRKAPTGTIDQAQFSPDGRWVAYNANETDRFEVYVTPFPTTGHSQLISSGGGVQPVWRADSRELYYLGLNGMLHAVALRPDGERLRVVDRELFQTEMGAPSPSIEQYAASADGQRFLLLKPVDNKVRNSIGVDFNWPALLTAGRPR